MIREANIEDVRAIAEIVSISWKDTYKNIFPKTYLDSLTLEFMENKWTNLLNNSENSKNYVYEDGNKINGIIRFGKCIETGEKNFGEIFVLYLRISEKGKGIGKSLFQFAINELIRMGYKTIIVWCAKENKGAIEFYKKMGGIIKEERNIDVDGNTITEVKLIYYFDNSHIANFQKIPYYPISFQKGNEAILYDYDGNEYIDFLASAGSANIGHGNKEIADAVYNQMNKITQYASVYFQMKEGEILAEKLLKVLERDNMQVAYSNSGSEAIDCAIKLAKAYTKRNKIISFKESYHGATYGALSISAISLNMRNNIGTLIPDVYHIEYPNCFRCKYKNSNKCNKYYCIKELTDAFDTYIPANEVAAIFLEPIAGDMGIVVPPKEYIKKVQELCHKYAILLVVDEIQQGMCRTGKWCSFQNFNINPDIIVLGKSIGAGLPLGVTIANRNIMASIAAPAHVFTMSGNSTICTAAIKQIEIFERENINEQVIEKGNYLMNKLKTLMNKYEIIGEIRGIGLSIGIDIVDNRKNKNKNYTAAAKISYNCIKNGLLLTFIGKSTLRVQPPLVITKEQIDKAIEIIDNAFDSYINNKIDDNVLSFVQGW